MAKLPALTLSNTVNDLREHINSLNLRLGDLALLNTPSDSDLVDAINSLEIDSAGLTVIARDAISVTDAGGEGSLTYNSTTGILTYTGASLSGGAGITFAGGVISITDDGVDQTKLANVQTLVIYDSTGAAVKTLYAAGS